MFIKTHKSFYKNFIQNYCLKSDLMTFVSNGTLNCSNIPKTYNGKCLIVHNGFMSYYSSLLRPNKKMTISYAGAVYGERHFYSVFEAIKLLSNQNKDPLLIDINFYGDYNSFNAFVAEAREYEIEKYIHYKDFLGAKEMNNELTASDMLLIASWNYPDYYGVLPGKLFEYMSYLKPIIGHVSGTLPNSEIKDMINKHNLGFCSDDIEKNDYKMMFDYIKNQYDYFLKNNRCLYLGDLDYTDSFLREKQVKEIKRVIFSSDIDIK